MQFVAYSIFNQRVEADASSLGGYRSLGMQCWRYAHHELAASLFLRCNTVFGTSLKKEVQRSAELATEFIRCTTVKVSTTIQTLNLAELGIWAE